MSRLLSDFLSRQLKHKKVSEWWGVPPLHVRPPEWVSTWPSGKAVPIISLKMLGSSSHGKNGYIMVETGGNKRKGQWFWV